MSTNLNAQTQLKPRELTCFIIMPFSEITFRNPTNENKTLSEEQLTHIYEKLFKRAVETYNRDDIRFTANRYTSQRGNFVKGIISDLDTAYLVIADLTGLNPNVFYELGVRHTLKSGTLMLTQNKKELASDLSNYIAIEYKYPKTPHEFDRYYTQFEKELHAAIDEVLGNTDRTDNPVRDFIGDRNIFRNEQRIREIKGNIELMRLIEKEYLRNINKLGKQIESWSREESDAIYMLENTAEPFINRLIIFNERGLVIEFIINLIRSMQVTQYNMANVMRAVIKKKDPSGCDEFQFGFKDTSGKYYSIWDLYDHYKRFKEDVSTIQPCLIVLHFRKFVKDWEDELQQLTK